MKKAIALMGILVLIPIVFAAITYDFDSVNVLYAAEFDATAYVPQEGEGVGAGATWVDDLVGDDGEIYVLFGDVELMNGAEVAAEEQFIRVEGSEGFERFLSNSQNNGYYENGDIQYIKTQFWSAKKLDGSQVVKNFDEPVKSVIFQRNFGENGEVTAVKLQFIDGSDNTNTAFWSGDQTIGARYDADMGTFYYASEIVAGVPLPERS